MDAALAKQVIESNFLYGCLTMSATAVLYYDYILTFHREVTLIWFSPWSHAGTYTNILFLLTRYIALVDSTIFLYNQTLHDVSNCPTTLTLSTVMSVIHQLCAEAILSLRTWALFRGNRKIGVLLLISILLNVAVQVAVQVLVLLTIKFAPRPFPEYTGCFVVAITPLVWISPVTWTAVIAVMLVLMMISAYRACRGNFRVMSKLSGMVHYDGLLSYTYLFVITVINAILFACAKPSSKGLFGALGYALYAVFATRIVLNIRQVSREDPALNTGEFHGEFEYSQSTNQFQDEIEFRVLTRNPEESVAIILTREHV